MLAAQDVVAVLAVQVARRAAAVACGLIGATEREPVGGFAGGVVGDVVGLLTPPVQAVPLSANAVGVAADPAPLKPKLVEPLVGMAAL